MTTTLSEIKEAVLWALHHQIGNMRLISADTLKMLVVSAYNNDAISLGRCAEILDCSITEVQFLIKKHKEDSNA